MDDITYHTFIQNKSKEINYDLLKTLVQGQPQYHKTNLIRIVTNNHIYTKCSVKYIEYKPEKSCTAKLIMHHDDKISIINLEDFEYIICLYLPPYNTIINVLNASIIDFKFARFLVIREELILFL